MSAPGGTWPSSGTASKTCPRPANASASLRRRTGSSPEKGSSSKRIGGSPSSSPTASARPMRSDSAVAQASPWEANPRAASPSTTSPRSSRCGPTSVVRRTSSSSRLSASRRTKDSSSPRASASASTDGRYSTTSASSSRPAPFVSMAPALHAIRSIARIRRSVKATPLATSSASQAPRSGGSPAPAQSLSSRFRCRSARS